MRLPFESDFLLARYLKHFTFYAGNNKGSAQIAQVQNLRMKTCKRRFTENVSLTWAFNTSPIYLIHPPGTSTIRVRKPRDYTDMVAITIPWAC